MNICFLCPNPENTGSGVATIGGLERAAHLLANELRRRGHSVEFYAFFRPSPHRRFHIPFVTILCRFFMPDFLSPHWCSEGLNFRKFLKEHKIDVIVWHNRASGDFPFSLKNLPCRLITVFHNAPYRILSSEIYTDRAIKWREIRSPFVKWVIRSRLCRFLLWEYYTFLRNYPLTYATRRSDKFVLLSERFIPEFAPAKKFPQKVCAISNIAPFEAQNVAFESKKRELLWLGRVEFTHKRPDYMLQIWQRLQNRFPDWSLRFVGEGDYLPELKTLAKELGVQRVFFEGYQNPISYYRSAPIFCMTSTFEGLPMTLLEAQSFGCVPIVFESYSSVRDIIEDGVNGFLIPPFDIDAYAGKLATLMQDPELRERFARNGGKSISKFSAEAIGDKYAQLLRGGGHRKKRELLWLGRVEFTQKRPDFMLQIWQRLQDRFPDWSLRFVGDGGYLSKLKALAKELGVQRVFFEGFKNPTPYYYSAPIYCMTSTFEGFGLTLVEAQAFSCVPVAFDSHGAFRDIIYDGVNGVLVPPFDLDAYAEKLAELMSDSELQERLAQNGQKSIAKFSAEAIGDKWDKLLSEVARENL